MMKTAAPKIKAINNTAAGAVSELPIIVSPFVGMGLLYHHLVNSQGGYYDIY
jgi:hypothetical protein